ncbi:MAG: 50S ribosomal protein L17 [Desulfuromonas sp.]|nr:MAG: 50S ribosomal protein L17 [Desulfuromonas sp.]
MRHNKTGRRLGRKPDHRAHMMRNMVTSFLEHERITTTDTRAKELRKVVERMITLGKRGELHARRQALQVIRDEKVVNKLFDLIAPRYQDRPGGYTRIIKLNPRVGDRAPMAVIELVEEEYTPKQKAKAPAVEASETVAEPAAEVAEEAAPVEEVEAEPAAEVTAEVESAEAEQAEEAATEKEEKTEG